MTHDRRTFAPPLTRPSSRAEVGKALRALVRERSLGADLRVGVWFGLFFGCLYSLLAVVVYIARGAVPLARQGVTLGDLLAIYFAGGFTGGIVFALLRPLTRWRAGAVLVGIVTVIPYAFGLVYAAGGGVSEWGAGEWLILITVALALGGGVALRQWEPPT